MNGQGSTEGFGAWNKDIKEPKGNREQRQRERKSRWGDPEPEDTPEAETEANIPELETCGAPPVTDTADMDLEAPAPEMMATSAIEVAETQEMFPAEDMSQPQMQEMFPAEDMSHPQMQETTENFQESNVDNPVESLEPPRSLDFGDVGEQQMPDPVMSEWVSGEGTCPPEAEER